MNTLNPDDFSDAMAGDSFNPHAPADESPDAQPEHDTDAPPALPAPLSAATLLAQPIQPREWLVESLIPVGCATLLASDGGIGKSLLAQQIASAVAAGTSLFGLQVTQASSLAIYAEDDANELVCRQQDIAREMQLLSHHLRGAHLHSLFGQQTHLGHFDRNGVQFHPGPLFTAMRDQAIELGCRLVIVDNVTQVFPGDINSSQQVASFLQALNGLAIEINGAVLVLGHIAKSEGSTFSGSAAWNNSVRHRLFMEWRDDPGKGARNNLRTLSVEKANYAAKSAYHIEWKGGCFHLDQPITMASPRFSDRDRFLDCLDRLTKRQRSVSSKTNARNNAPKVMSSEYGFEPALAKQAMEDLLASGEIEDGQELGWCNSSREKVRGLARILPGEWLPEDERQEALAGLGFDAPAPEAPPPSTRASKDIENIMAGIRARTARPRDAKGGEA